MLTLPKIETRPAQAYLTISQHVVIPFGDVVEALFDKVEAYLQSQGISDFGPAIIKYNLIDMPRLEVEFGFVTPSKVAATGEFISGELPAGQYATTLYTGPHDNLMDVNAVLIGWAKQKGIVWDAEETAAGDKFVSRIEYYFDPPIGDPNSWRTEVAIKSKS